tara:strand:- start:1621 stop:2394 length:774 start_codon:yes stop_codon:yes gene_type:complete
MAFKRLIATILVKDGFVVKSYSYKNWLPSGNLITALKNLDRWNVDEILLIDISRKGKLNKAILDEIKRSRISTPLIYGGGIRNLDDVKSVLNVGCDRILIESLLINKKNELKNIYEHIGKQALITSLVINFNSLKTWDYQDQTSDSDFSLTEAFSLINQSPISEILIIDQLNEGSYGKFSMNIYQNIKRFYSNISDGSLIWFGGLDIHKSTEILKDKKTIGIAFGNKNYEEELFMPKLRLKLKGQGKQILIRNLPIN